MVWRGDVYANSGVDLCYWLKTDTVSGAAGDGFYDANHQLVWYVYDEDEDSYTSASPVDRPAASSRSYFSTSSSRRSASRSGR